MESISFWSSRQRPRCAQLTQPFWGKRLPLWAGNRAASIWPIVAPASWPNPESCSSEIEVLTLGYTATLAVSEDHLIVGQRVTQESNDNEALLPMVDLVEQQCGEKP